MSTKFSSHEVLAKICVERFCEYGLFYIILTEIDGNVYAIMLPSRLSDSSVARFIQMHFLPTGVAHMIGLSHNPYTWRPL